MVFLEGKEISPKLLCLLQIYVYEDVVEGLIPEEDLVLDS